MWSSSWEGWLHWMVHSFAIQVKTLSIAYEQARSSTFLLFQSLIIQPCAIVLHEDVICVQMARSDYPFTGS
jgi:hypothetical protein